MGRPTTKQELLEQITTERARLVALLAEIPPGDKHLEVTDGLSVKDLLAHRTEWGRMLLRWYHEAAAGGTPGVPSDRYRWNQLDELNAEIHAAYRDTPLAEVEAAFAAVHEELLALVHGLSEAELFAKPRFAPSGASTLASYVTSATAAHDRSATKLIRRWWKARLRSAS